MTGRFVSRGIVEAAVGASRARVGVTRWLRAFDLTLAGVGASALTSVEIEAVTQACYERFYHPTCSREGLFEWEKDCLRRFWPESGSVLLVGAGNGRELVALEERGYEVWALEPVPEAAARCRSRTRHPERVVQAGFRELPGASREPGRLGRGLPSHFDSVIIGWGAFSHCFGDSLRRGVFRELASLCPSGPVLVSFVASADGPGHPAGKGYRTGTRLGHGIRRVRRLSEVEDLPCLFVGAAGFALVYDRSSLGALASLGGWAIAHYESGHTAYPHAVLLR